MQNHTRAALALLLAAAAAQPALAETFRCEQADGSVSFQQLPCARPQRPLPVTAPRETAAPAAGLDAATPEDLPRPNRRQREALEITARLQHCRAALPAFVESSEAVYQAWRYRHAGTLQVYEVLLPAKLREIQRDQAALASCTEEWLRALQPLTQMPDSRFSSVEKTWSVFLAALRAADRQTAARCLTGRAEARWKQRVDALSDEDLRRIAAGIREFRIQWGDDYEKEGLVASEGNRVGGIAFRNLNEEWKIADL